ncbi:Sulfofructose kinase [Chelatococcus asaccharovorans]|nr:Sulfofructose kinase [Chelatococcus asaccharovorans]CAH1693229.1 Sulfofructose kinase [Chelatococcus asaccharovorans]
MDDHCVIALQSRYTSVMMDTFASPPRPARIVCVGTTTMDFIFGLDSFPVGPLKFRAKSFHAVGGGNAGTAAVAIQRLGGEAHLMARVGDDPIGRQALDELRSRGINTDLMMVHPGAKTTLASIMIDGAGERQIVSYTDPNLPTTVENVDLPAGTDALLADARWSNGALHMMRRARAAGVPTVLDGDIPVIPDELLALSCIAAFSRQALAENTGSPEVEEGLRRLARRTPGVPVVTDGAKGLYWLEHGQLRHMPAFKVDVRDTLGAGDVFHGALALAIGRGEDVAQALRFGSAAAAVKVTRFGGREGCPDADEVERLLAGAA